MLQGLSYIIRAGVILTFAGCSQAPAYDASENTTIPDIQAIYWSDGDSGRIDGQQFRLNDIDAPETGGVGAAVGGQSVRQNGR